MNINWARLHLQGARRQVLTQEPAGVDGYALSPDGKTILYTVIGMNGDSSLKAINSDGSDPHLVLNCPQTECEQPVWYPRQPESGLRAPGYFREHGLHPCLRSGGWTWPQARPTRFSRIRPLPA